MHIFKFLLLTLLFISLHAQGSSSEKVTLQLQWKHQFEFAGFYVAQEKGYYKDLGLDVEILEYDASKNIIDEVVNGEADFGVTYSALIASYIEGKPVVLLANFFKQSPLILVTQREIESPKDLRGKKVMGLSESIHNIPLIGMLDRFDMSSSDVVNIHASFNIDDFVNKKVDAMSVFSTNELYYLDRKNVKYSILNPSTYGAKYYDANLFTSTTEIKKHPLRVKKFREASIKGWEYALSHQKEVVSLILEKYNTQNKTEGELLFEAKQIEAIMLPKVHRVGSVDIDRVESMAEHFVKFGFVNQVKQRDLSHFVYEYDYNPLDLNKQERAYLEQHPVLYIQNEFDRAPYNYNAKGKAHGFSVDYMRLLASKMGVDVEFISGYTRHEFLAMIKEKKIDILTDVSKSAEREAYLNFAPSYLNLDETVITTEGYKNLKKLSDFEGKNVAVVAGSSEETLLQTYYPKIHLIKSETREKAFKAVAFGKADATIETYATARYFIAQYNLSNLYLSFEIADPHFKRAMHLATHKENTVLEGIVEKAQQYVDEKEMLKLKEKWFGAKENVTALKLSESQKTFLMQKRLIKMCVHPDWLPFEKIENGIYIGLASDYMYLLSKKIHAPITLVKTKSWEESLTMAAAKQCDILPMVANTESKASLFDFTSPYIKIPLVLATKHDQIFIDNIQEYLDKEWGVVKGYSMVEVLKERYPSMKIVVVDTLAEGLKAVEKGELFGEIDNAVTMTTAIQKEFIGTISIRGKLDEKIAYSIASRKDEPVLHTILEKALGRIDTQSKQKLSNRWIKIHDVSKVDYTLVWQVLGGALVILIIVMYRSMVLKREVKKRIIVEKELHALTKNLSSKVHEATMDLEEKNHKLSESVSSFEDIFNSTVELIIIFEEDGTIIDINRPGLKKLEYLYKDDIVGTKISAHVLETDLLKLYEDLQSNQQSTYEIIVLKRDHSQIQMLNSTRRVLRNGKKVRMAMLFDLTEIKEKNSHIIQQSKMHALDKMVGHMTSQWHEPLKEIYQSSKNISNIMQKKSLYDEQIESQTIEIETLSMQMRRTIDEFREFFVQDRKVSSFLLSDAVLKAVKIASPSFQSSKIQLVFNVSKGVLIHGYPNELQQAVMVLINNAKDVLVARKVAQPKVTISVVWHEQSVAIEVEDNAGGIDPHIIDHVFDSDFTTKKAIDGVGMGLYISKMIVEENMHGTLTVRNVEGGSCFSIDLSTS